MRFSLVDAVLEREAGRIVTLKLVSSAEEYLAEHFAGFPVLPGVFMLEAMVQAARELEGAGGPPARLALGGVRAFKYARFVRPGETLRVEVERAGDGEFRGAAYAVPAGEADGALAASGRFSLRPLRM